MTERFTTSLDRGERLGLLGLCALAIGARAIGLDAGLWVDEVVALVSTYRESLGSQFTVFYGDFDHTLYSVFAKLSVLAFGESPWTIRLPALLFGVATIPLTYLLGRELIGRRDAWLSAGFLALFYPHVWFSQNARGYTMLAFFSALATLLLIRHLRGEERKLSWGYAASLALGVYTHLTMIFLAAGHGLVGLAAAGIQRWDRARIVGFVSSFVLAGVLTLVLYAPLLTQVIDFFQNSPSRLTMVSTPLWALLEAIRVLQRGLGAGTTVGVLGAAFLFGLGVLSYARRAPWALALCLAPGVVTLVGAILTRGTMYPRFFFFMVAFLTLILIRGIVVMGDWMGERVWRERPQASFVAPAMVAVLVAGSIYGLVTVNYRYPKQDYAGAIEFVEAQARPGDTIVRVGNGAYPIPNLYQRDYPLIETTEDIERHRSVDGRLWMIFTFPLYIEAQTPAVMDAIDAGCSDRETFPGSLGGGDLIVCSFPPMTTNG